MDEKEIQKQEPLPIKKIYWAYIFFMIAQVLVTISLMSYGANFKFLPRWLENLSLLALVSYVLFIVSTFLLRKVSKHFFYSLIAISLLLASSIIQDICRSSNEGIYLAWARGLELTMTFLDMIFVCYFLQGTFHLLTKYENKKAAQKTKGALITFIVIFALNLLVFFTSKLPVVINHLVANRVTTYSYWALQFIFYVYTLVVVISSYIYIHIIHRTEANNEKA